MPSYMRKYRLDQLARQTTVLSPPCRYHIAWCGIQNITNMFN